MVAPWKETYDKPRQHIQKQRHHFTDESPRVKFMFVLVVTYGCESWTIKKAERWRIVMLESPLDYKKIKSVNLKGNQPWIFTGRTDVETSTLWPPDVKSQVTGIDPDTGKDWRQKEKRVGRGWNG